MFLWECVYVCSIICECVRIIAFSTLSTVIYVDWRPPSGVGVNKPKTLNRLQTTYMERERDGRPDEQTLEPWACMTCDIFASIVALITDLLRLRMMPVSFVGLKPDVCSELLFFYPAVVVFLSFWKEYMLTFLTLITIIHPSKWTRRMETPAFVLDGSDHHMCNMLEERMKSVGNDYIASNNLVGTK